MTDRRANAEAPSSDAERAIVAATVDVLATEGCAGLTTRAVAEASGKSQGIVRHYYDDTAALLAAVAADLAGRRAPTLDGREGDPVERLRAGLDAAVPATLSADRRRYEVARLELEAAAVRREFLREPLAERDRALRDELAGIVADGAETGAFRADEPRRAADRLLGVGDGALRRAVTLDRPDALDSGRATLDALVRSRVPADARWPALSA